MQLRDECELLQEDVYDMSSWSDKCLLLFHPQTCKYMRLSNANVGIKEYRLTKDQTPMERTKEEKDIGVIIDNKLSFDQHISEKTNKANSSHK